MEGLKPIYKNLYTMTSNENYSWDAILNPSQNLAAENSLLIFINIVAMFIQTVIGDCEVLLSSL